MSVAVLRLQTFVILEGSTQFLVLVKHNNAWLHSYFYIGKIFSSVDYHQVVFTKIRITSVWYRQHSKTIICYLSGTKYFASSFPSGFLRLQKIFKKGKSHPRTGNESPEAEQIYSSTISLTSAPDEMGGQRHVPSALFPVMTRYIRLCRPQGRSERVWKISNSPRFDPRTVQSGASRFTD